MYFVRLEIHVFVNKQEHFPDLRFFFSATRFHKQKKAKPKSKTTPFPKTHSKKTKKKQTNQEQEKRKAVASIRAKHWLHQLRKVYLFKDYNVTK